MRGLLGRCVYQADTVLRGRLGQVNAAQSSMMVPSCLQVFGQILAEGSGNGAASPVTVGKLKIHSSALLRDTATPPQSPGTSEPVSPPPSFQPRQDSDAGQASVPRPSSSPGLPIRQGLQPRAPPVTNVNAALLAQQKKVATIYVVSTKNNTICTVVDMRGRVVASISGGSVGFKNSRKSTQFAAQATGERVAETVLAKGFFKARIVLKGIGRGKQSAVRAIAKSQIEITELHEHTAIPHNGCRQPRRRRV